MCGLLPEIGRQFQVIFLIWVSFTCLIVSSLTIEERLQVLEAANIEIEETLAAKDDRLKALEIEVQNLKSLNTLNTENEFEDGDIVSSISLNNQPPTNSKLFRTCREAHLADPSLESGLHWIDPDGQGVGDGPIQVYCNKTTGVTSIPHDSESPTNVGHCIRPGCYSKSIKYSATIRQMNALAELSDECHQEIKYDCNYAPFEMRGVASSWWNDRNGNPQYFWAGSNSSVHTCQCGIDKNCIEPDMTCNCDSNLPMPQFDSGLIKEKNLLPVTQLNFGRTWLNISSGVYTLGRLECSGQVTVNEMASSCADLWRIGHTLSGFYSVMGNNKMIESVYCDFSKLPSETGFENQLGYVDVKSLPTYFYVQRNTDFQEEDARVPFELEIVNIGGAMNLTSGIFTAPRTGLYFISFSSPVCKVDFANDGVFLEIFMRLNEYAVGSRFVEFKRGYFDTISFQETLSLKLGDQVCVEVLIFGNAKLSNRANQYTYFTGHLLQEDISQTLDFKPHSLDDSRVKMLTNKK